MESGEVRDAVLQHRLTVVGLKLSIMDRVVAVIIRQVTVFRTVMFFVANHLGSVKTFY